MPARRSLVVRDAAPSGHPARVRPWTRRGHAPLEPPSPAGWAMRRPPTYRVHRTAVGPSGRTRSGARTRLRRRSARLRAAGLADARGSSRGAIADSSPSEGVPPRSAAAMESNHPQAATAVPNARRRRSDRSAVTHHRVIANAVRPHPSGLLGRPEAAARAPMLVARLRRLREARAAHCRPREPSRDAEMK
jgi:hypothetical protein